MGLKAGWLALFLFVWLIGAFLGSTFEYQASGSTAGVSYSTGTATFTNGSDVVTSGGGAVWTTAMEGGNIKGNADGIWVKIRHVGGGYIRNNGGTIATSPATLAIGANAITVTQLGQIAIVLPTGSNGTAVGGVCTVVGSPVALVAGTNIISTTDVVGGITVNVVGATVMFLYSPYVWTGGAGLAYTIQPSPGWVGSGTGGYTSSPTTKLGYLLNLSNAVQRIELLGAIPFPIPNGEYFKAVFEVITWRWSFLTDYGMFYWIFCVPFVVMGVLSMILLVYGVLTGNLTL